MGSTSHRDRRRDRCRKNRSSRKRSSGSSSDGSTNQHRIKRLEELVKELRNSSRDSSRMKTASPTPYRKTYAEDELMIPIFDPLKDTITIEQWVQQIDELAKQYDWNDRSVFRLIMSRLEGHAKEWFNLELQQQNTIMWAETKVALVQHFRKSMPFAKLLREAVSYETSPSQSLGDYCLQKLNKIKRCNLGISEECIIDLIIDGVKNNRIQRDIRAAGKTTTNALYHLRSNL